MKKHILGFLRRGLLAAAGGPVVLAIIYGILGANGTISSLSPQEVCKGILTITLMAFIAAGSNEIYQVERLALPFAIGIHALALYTDYILVYLVNGWIKNQLMPILVFTCIFVGGFCAVWLAILLITKHSTSHINKKLHTRDS